MTIGQHALLHVSASWHDVASTCVDTGSASPYRRCQGNDSASLQTKPVTEADLFTLISQSGCNGHGTLLLDDS